MIDFERLQRLVDLAQRFEPDLQADLNQLPTAEGEAHGLDALRKGKIVSYLNWRLVRQMGWTDSAVGGALQLTIGCSLYGEGAYTRAALYLERATALLRQHLGPLHRQHLIALFHWARTLDALGQAHRVLPAMEESIHEAQLAQISGEELDALEDSLASLYQRSGNRMRAQRLLERALASRLARLGRDERRTLETMLRLATTLDPTHEKAQIHALLQEVKAAVDLHPGVFWADRVRKDYHRLAADLAALTANNQEREQHLRATIRLQHPRALVLDPTVADTYLKLAESRLEAGQSIEALEPLLELQVLGEDLLWMSAGDRKRFHLARLQVIQSYADFAEVTHHARAYMDAFAEEFRERLPALVEAERTKAAGGLWTAIREYLVFVLSHLESLGPAGIAHAYSLVLEFKGVVADSLCIARERRAAAFFPALRDDLERRSELRRQLQETYAGTFQGLPENEQEQAASKLRFEKHAIEERLRREAPEALEPERWSIADSAEALATLAPDSVLIDFVRAETGPGPDSQHLAIFLLPAGRADLLSLGVCIDLAGLQSAIEDWHRELAAGRQPDTESLWNMLWARIEEALDAFAAESGTPVKRLLVSPDDAIHSLPLAALRRPGTDEYLLDRYEISYLCSGRDLANVLDLRPAAGASPLCIGIRHFADRPPLPFAEAEALQCAAQLGGEVWTGTATAAGFRQRLHHVEGAPYGGDWRSPEILHISTHGSWADGRPPGLAVSDGVLSLNDISGLDLRDTRLTVLSACDSGAGQVQSGEGVFGLQRSFQIAGSRALLATLWPVDDFVTKKLMTVFYAKIRIGMTPVSALRAAQANLRSGAFRQLSYWGPFVLIGLSLPVRFNSGAR